MSGDERGRYSSVEIKKLRLNPREQLSEAKKYALLEYQKDLFTFQDIKEDFINSHINYINLFIIISESCNFIDKDKSSKLLEIVEGYCYAFDQGLIDSVQLFEKLNNQIMVEELGQKDFNHLGVLEDDLHK